MKKSKHDLLSEIEDLKRQLEDANETIEAIRTGQIDALVVQANDGHHQLFTLKSADQTYRVFIEKMTEGAVTLNQEGIIVYCNSKFASMVNLPLSKVLGLHFHHFIAEATRKDFERLFSNCWDVDCRGELMLQGEDLITPVQLSLTTLELDEGVSVSIIITDLTMQKAAQEQLSSYNDQLKQTNRALEDSNHDLQQFASVASHDLQEPLRKIQIFSNMLLEKSADAFKEESARHLKKIIDSAARMKMLITDILNYSSLASTMSQHIVINLSVLIQDVLQDFDLIIHEKEAKITVHELPDIEVNKGQMRQVFQNMISNALKFSRAGVPPVIEISSKRIAEKSVDSKEDPQGAYSQITISDNGIGFNEHYTNNIFDLFERLHSKDKYEGTGIGLAIAKKIIEKHSGFIHVKSREGIGSEFILILPLAQELRD